MAIENIWIIDITSGICIYDWCVPEKQKTIDEQLVSGLLLAFRNFSSEAGLVDISAIEGIDKKLAYKTDDKYIIAAISHSKDYEPLINKTILGLLKDFRDKYKKIIDAGPIHDVSPFRTFDEDLERKLEGKTASRTAISIIVGAIISMAVVALFFVLYFFTINSILNAVPDGGDFIGLILILLGFIFAGIIGGLIAGERRYGLIASFISVIPVFSLFIAFFFLPITSITDFIFRSLLYLLLFTIMSLSGGLFGGYLKERKFFYPINIQSKDI